VKPAKKFTRTRSREDFRRKERKHIENYGVIVYL
jgi:hypothetical protein